MINTIKEKILQRPQTTLIILLNTIIFLTLNVYFSIDDPYSLFKKGSGLGISIYFGEWWRLIFSGFLHLNFFHLFSNSLVLWIAGASVEKLVGRSYILFYLFSIIATACFSSFFHFLIYTVGSSGATFAVLGYLWFAIYKQDDGTSTARSQKLIGIKFLSYVTIGGLIPTSAHVDYAAHISGFILGIIFYYIEFVIIKNKFKSILTYGFLTILILVAYYLKPFPDSYKNLEAIREIAEVDEFELNINQCEIERKNLKNSKKYLNTSSCRFLIENSSKIDEVLKHSVDGCKKNDLTSCKYMNYIYTLIEKKELSLPYKEVLCQKNYYDYCDRIGDFYLWDEKYKESIPYFIKACEANIAESCTQLGFSYYKLGYDIQEQKKYNEKGCTLGDYLGCSNLACNYCREKNIIDAVISFKKFINLSEKNSISKNELDFIFTDKEIDCIKNDPVWIEYEKKFKTKN